MNEPEVDDLKQFIEFPIHSAMLAKYEAEGYEQVNTLAHNPGFVMVRKRIRK